MRKEKALISMLRGLVDLISDEAASNPEFSSRLELLLSPLPKRKTPQRKRPVRLGLDLPDIYREFNSRGQAEFALWLRDQPIDLLRAVIRMHDLDATRRTSKWKDSDKLSHFITEQIRARMARGSGFLTGDSGT